MKWRVCGSLLRLLEQYNARFPNRSRRSDGTIGDTAHQSQGTDSDHNPWYVLPNGDPTVGLVRALDITHDPGAGADIDVLSDELAASRDPRISYVICNGLIMSGNGGPQPWVWREYAGSDPHTGHMHVSVVAAPRCDDSSVWAIPQGAGSTMDGQQYAEVVKGALSPVNVLHWRLRGIQDQDDPKIGPLGRPTTPGLAQIMSAVTAVAGVAGQALTAAQAASASARVAAERPQLSVPVTELAAAIVGHPDFPVALGKALEGLALRVTVPPF